MNVRVRFSLLLLVVLAVSGCAMAGAPRSSRCPSPGTEVPFAKLVTPGYAEDYVGCDITTLAQFVAPGAGAWALPVPIEGKTVFRVLPQGVAGERNPLSGEIQANFVVIPKAAGDLMFRLKAGDIVRLRGGTYVESATAYGKLLGVGGFSSIVFIATAMEAPQR